MTHILPETVDTLYRAEINRDPVFSFDERVAAVFPDMIRRSVPGYQIALSMIGSLAAKYAQAGTHIYDLGCALGAVTMAMYPRLRDSGCTIIAVDNAPAMIARCKENLRRDHMLAGVEVCCEDIRQICLHNASFVVLNYTLQFIPIADRKAVLEQIYAALLPGAMLVLSEKIIEADSKDQQLMMYLHEQFKRQNGYNDLEICRKRKALEYILSPETSTAHMARLAAVGFENTLIGLKFLNFVSILAIKPNGA